MKTITTFAFYLLMTSIFTLGVNAQEPEFELRPGSEQAEVTDRLDNQAIEKWTMRSGELGAAPMEFHITSEHSYHGTDYWFNTTVEMEFPAAVRQQVYNNLTDAYYNDVKLTDRGVSYVIISSTDLAIRTLTEAEAIGKLKFEPHDCTRVLGECAFVRTQPDGQKSALIRTSAFADGIWTDRLNYDQVQDTQGRADLLEESRFSVDTTGVTIDMEKKTYKGDKQYLTVLKRIYEKQEDVEQPDRPSLPSGNYANIGMSCNESLVLVEVGPARQTIMAGKRALIRNAGSKPKIECTSDTALETSCTSRGYILVIYKNDYTALGCYKGSPPPNPWGQD